MLWMMKVVGLGLKLHPKAIFASSTVIIVIICHLLRFWAGECRLSHHRARGMGQEAGVTEAGLTGSLGQPRLLLLLNLLLERGHRGVNLILA